MLTQLLSTVAAFQGGYGGPPAPRAAVAQRVAVMAAMPLPAGSLVALATPMNADGDVDIPALRELLRQAGQQEECI